MTTTPFPEPRRWSRAMRRGFFLRCPRCGEGRLRAGYLAIRPSCAVCGLDFSAHRADDAPPYVTTLLVGHLLIPAVVATKQLFDPPVALQFAIFLPAFLAMTVALLPAVKGALIGLQWTNRMHGFGGAAETDDA